jgi:type VI secretion system VasI/ImpG family protein
MELLDYYRDNLSYLRHLSGEFAAEYPKIARRLLLSEVDCQDPYIERLLEGTAFLAARVEKKLDESYYPFLEAVLNSVAPDVIYPIPSGAVLEVFPDASDENVRKGTVIEAGTVFEATVPGVNTPCRFSCAAASPIVPFTIIGAEYLSRDVANMGLKNARAESALRLRFSLTGHFSGKIAAFLALSEADASLLLRLLAEDVAGVYLNNKGEYTALDGVKFTVPLQSGEELFDKGAKSGIRGLRILRNYLKYPDFFKFFSFSIKGLSSPAAENGAEIVIAFKRREQSLAAVVKPSSVRVNCVPALNLYSRRSNRIVLEDESSANPYEFHLVPDRTAMRDYEVVAVKNIDFYNQRNDQIARAANFYDGDPVSESRNFFSTKRRKKPVERRSAARSSYDGTEVFVSFSDLPEGAWQFAADLLVTNRDLPLLLPDGITLISSSSIAPRAVFLSLPTRPDYPLVEHGNREDFSRLSHIVMNLSAMLFREGTQTLELLRNMLRSYPLRPAEEMERMIGGIIALSGKSDTFRFVRNGGVFYEWGWRISLVLDENAYAGMGFYLFARVVAEVLLSLTPLNAVLELNFSTVQSGVIAVWKTPEDR